MEETCDPYFSRFPGKKNVFSLIYGNEKIIINDKNIKDFSDKKGQPYIAGHFPYGIHNHIISETETQYFTMLRDPIKRTVSSLRYCLGHGNPMASPNTTSREFYKSSSVYEFLERCLEKQICCNMITRQMSGIEDRDVFPHVPIEQLQKGSLFTPAYANLYPGFKYSNSEMNDLFKSASENIKKFCFVGDFDNREKDFVNVSKIFNWTCKKDIPKAHSSPDIFSINESHLPILEEMNKYDIKFYNETKKAPAPNGTRA